MRNLVPDFLAFWEIARDADDERRRELWDERYAARHPDVFASYERHLFPGAFEAAWPRFPDLVPRLPSRASSVRDAIDRTTPAILAEFELEEPNCDWVVMVGVRSSNGWADMINDRMTCFCAVEVLADDDNLPLLVAHETAHAAHMAVNPDSFAETWEIGETLFAEGLATIASMRIVPGVNEPQALWVRSATLPDGSDTASWLAQCEASWPALRSALSRDTSSTHPDVYAAYFLGRRDDPAFPIRAGYFAGLRLIAELNRNAPVAELARWPPERVRTAIARLLNSR